MLTLQILNLTLKTVVFSIVLREESSSVSKVFLTAFLLRIRFAYRYIHTNCNILCELAKQEFHKTSTPMLWKVFQTALENILNGFSPLAIIIVKILCHEVAINITKALREKCFDCSFNDFYNGL